MALYSLINSYSRNRLHSGFCRHFGQRNIAIWRTFICTPEVTSLLDSTRSSPSLAASCAGITKHLSIWSKKSFYFPCQKCRERRFNMSPCKSGLHCSRKLLQEEVLAKQIIKDEKLIESEGETTTLYESSVSEDVTKQYCQSSEVTVDTVAENTEINESLNCTVKRSTLNGAQTSPTKAMSKKERSSQATVTLTAERVDTFLMGFFGDRRIKRAARQHGINDVLFEKIFVQFRKKLLLQIRKGNAEMLKVFSTSYYKSDSMANLFPLFLAYARQAHPMLNCIDEVKKISDLRGPADLFPFAREMKRKIIFHAGPTNSGKTHTAIERFRASNTGLYCGPLRLLATEVFRRTNNAVSKVVQS